MCRSSECQISSLKSLASLFGLILVKEKKKKKISLYTRDWELLLVRESVGLGPESQDRQA